MTTKTFFAEILKQPKTSSFATGCGLPETHITREKFQDPVKASTLEWIETNGLGGYASSSVTGMNTRRYHSLLTAATFVPTGRTVTVSKLDESVITAGGAVDLATNWYPGALHPEGWRNIESFHIDPFPRWVFRAGAHFLEKTLFMVNGHNTTAIRYRWVDASGAPLAQAPTDCVLSLRPFFAFRDHHHLLKSYQHRDASATAHQSAVIFRPVGDFLPLVAHLHAAGFQQDPQWYYNFEYEIERRRGLDYSEDLFSPGIFYCDRESAESIFILTLPAQESGDAAGLAGSLLPQDIAPLFYGLARAEITRRRILVEQAGYEGDILRRLTLSADSYIVARGSGGKTVIAGYPWFTDWGRDTMIALPGLAITTRRYDIARETLLTFAKFVHRGLIPNRFPDEGETPSYNTVDAPMWFFIAAHSFIQTTSDYSILTAGLWDALCSIVDNFKSGTINNIHMEPDGLIYAGDPSTQLTWMDAKVGDWTVTPRYGKAVEINALWYNALRIMAGFAPKAGADPSPFSSLADMVAASFSEVFWNPATGCLFDVVNENGSDGSIRPNQLLALSLPHPLLSREQQSSTLAVAEAKLFTPYGMRSLAPDEPRYCGHYGGGVLERDGAYHQGTVWAWPVGPFISACFNVRGRNEKTAQAALDMLSGLIAHVTDDAGLNHVSEIFDGDPPHVPNGCFAQAWSVSELLRVLAEIDGIVPID